jgi:hypothetical protein
MGDGSRRPRLRGPGLQVKELTLPTPRLAFGALGTAPGGHSREACPREGGVPESNDGGYEERPPSGANVQPASTQDWSQVSGTTVSK